MLGRQCLKYFFPMWAFPALLLAFILCGGGQFGFVLFVMPLFCLAGVLSFVPFWRKKISISAWLVYGTAIPTAIGFFVGLVAFIIQALTIGVQPR